MAAMTWPGRCGNGRQHSGVTIWQFPSLSILTRMTAEKTRLPDLASGAYCAVGAFPARERKHAAPTVVAWSRTASGAGMASVLQFQSHPKWSALAFAACSSAAHLRHLPRRVQQDRPLAAFEGIWRPWTESAAPRPIHPKAMPVILTTPEEYETWLTAPAEVALGCSVRWATTCSRS